MKRINHITRRVKTDNALFEIDISHDEQFRLYKIERLEKLHFSNPDLSPEEFDRVSNSLQERAGELYEEYVRRNGTNEDAAREERGLDKAKP